MFLSRVLISLVCMRSRTVVLVVIVVAVVVLVIALLYPYLTFKPPEPVSANWSISNQSSLLSVVIYYDMLVKNPNPYSVSVASSSITVSYNDGVVVELQPEYLPIVLMPHSTSIITYMGSISLAQAAQLALSPPTSFTATWQATVQTPLGTKIVTCTAAINMLTNQTTVTCVG